MEVIRISSDLYEVRDNGTLMAQFVPSILERERPFKAKALLLTPNGEKVLNPNNNRPLYVMGFVSRNTFVNRDQPQYDENPIIATIQRKLDEVCIRCEYGDRIWKNSKGLMLSQQTISPIKIGNVGKRKPIPKEERKHQNLEKEIDILNFKMKKTPSGEVTPSEYRNVLALYMAEQEKRSEFRYCRDNGIFRKLVLSSDGSIGKKGYFKDRSGQTLKEGEIYFSI